MKEEEEEAPEGSSRGSPQLPSWVWACLRCPRCRGDVEITDKELACANPSCRQRFPFVKGVPVLLDEDSSLFRIEDVVTSRGAAAGLSVSPMRRTLRRLLPTLGVNVNSYRNFDRLARLLLDICERPHVLVVGGRVLGQGMEALLKHHAIELVDSDVALGPRTQLICDAHNLPFEDGVFDGVVLQAVVHFLVDPFKAVAEVARVTRAGGLVYAETPFMQQVHGGRHDFMRFTHLGHRRLFRSFQQIDSGPACGPGMALAWAFKYFLLSFAQSRQARRLITVFAHFTVFFLKYFDYHLIGKRGTYDAASGFYFLGRKGDEVLGDRDLVQSYQGCL